MNRRDFLATAALGTLLTSCAGRTPSPTAKTRKPKQNFLFILVDDLGWRDLGCFGSTFYETPRIDQLAREGMRFTDAYAACPVCSPTRASIMTGKYPARMATTDWFGAPQPDNVQNHKTNDKPLLPAPYEEELSRDEITIAEALKMSGYNTFFTGKWHLGGKGYYPEDQGFEINRGGYEKGSPNSYFSPYKNPKLKDGPDGEHLPDRLARESVQFLEANGKHPFLLFLSFYSVHTPLQGREDLIEKYKAKAKQVAHNGPDFIPEGERQARQVQDHPVYGAMVEAMDQAVGTVLDGLSRLGLEENTTVFFMSDNGGLSTSEGSPTSNVPLRAGKGWLYEGGIREPMIVKWPGVTSPGSECHHPVTSTDFYPTMLEIAGLPPRPEQHKDAVSFAPLLQGETLPKDRPLFWHYPHYGNQGGSPGAAVRLGAYKLIEFFEDGHFELYNLQDDPGEQCDLFHDSPNYAEPMIEMLHAWQREVGARFPTPNPNAKK